MSEVSLSKLLRPIERPEPVDPSRMYRLLGVRWYGEGLFEKESKMGQEIQAQRLFRVHEGDFVYNRLFAWKGSFAVADKNVDGCYVSNEFPCFQVNEERLDVRFLRWWFHQELAWSKALGLSQGATPTSRNRLKEEFFLAMTIPLPPLDVQRRVVARIEALAAQIHEASTLRQQAMEEAEALYGALTSSICHSSKWRSMTIEDLVGQTALRNGKSVKPSTVSNGVRCLTLSAMRHGRINLQDNKPVPLTMAEASTFLVKNGDVFVVRGNGSKELCGQAGMVTERCEGVIFPDLFIRVPLPEESVLTEFFVAVWNSAATRMIIEEKAKTTSGIWKINQGHIASTAIPIPPLADQRRIVSELDALQAEADALKRLQAKTAAELDALLPAILDRAFKGEL